MLLLLLLLASSDPLSSPPAPVVPEGRNVEAALVSQGVFDPGVHVFARTSFVNALEVRYHHELPTFGPRLAPEIAYGLGRSQADLGAGVGELYLHRLSVGGRASIPLRWRPLRGFARAGAIGMHATALVHDPYRSHREEASALGLYAGGGLELDAGPLTSTRNRLVVSMELGHAATTGFALGRMGRLDVNGVYVSWGARLRF